MKNLNNFTLKKKDEDNNLVCLKVILKYQIQIWKILKIHHILDNLSDKTSSDNITLNEKIILLKQIFWLKIK